MASEELSTMVDYIWETVPTVSERDVPGIATNSLSELHRYGDALFAASESLLKWVQRDGTSPYAAPVSRIHHLAGALCERLIECETGLPLTNELVNELTVMSSLNASEPAAGDYDITDLLEEPVHCSLAEVATESADDASALLTASHSPRVLVIDESPFIRMLLSLAIETAGYATLTLASLEEAEDQLNDSQGSDIVIWGGVTSATQTDCLTEWLFRREDSRRPMLIGLLDGIQRLNEPPVQFDQTVQFDQIICRTHLSELLSVIGNKLGKPQAIKKTA